MPKKDIKDIPFSELLSKNIEAKKLNFIKTLINALLVLKMQEKKY